MTESAIALAFPQPDRLIRHAFGQLRVARLGTDDEKRKQIGDIDPADLPRPWDPATCPPMLRKQVWVWLDQVAAWINHEYPWQYNRFIPACWPAHPHIAHELGVVAALRYGAGLALTANALDDWHRHTLPEFLDRMATRLGTNPCIPGKHNDWPAVTRFKDFESATALGRRERAINNDQRYSPPVRLSCPPQAATGSVNGAAPHGPPQLTVVTTTRPTQDGRDE